VRSTENADLASGHPNVVVLSPLGGRSQTPPEQHAGMAGQFEGLRRPPEWGVDLASQVESLRKQGSRVEVITLDADSLAAMARTSWIRRPASPPPVPVSRRASGRRPA
jgi:NTE family protein